MHTTQEIHTQCKVCDGKVHEFLPQFGLLQCANCGFIFYKYKLPIEKAKELYNSLYNQREEYSMYKKQAELLQQGKQPHLGYNKLKVLKFILKRKCNNIIEIGAGVGRVGFYLQQKKKQYTGIELDKAAAELANDAGVHVLTDSFERLSKLNSANVLLAFEVIEHIEDLGICLKMINQSLYPNGYFGFTVPNFNNYYKQSPEQQKRRLGQVGPPVHINFFTPETIGKILSLFGFKVLYVKARPFPYMIWRKKSTYKDILKSIVGKYEGATILCVAQKVK